jgi:transcriptional regulator with XRE-family HTH domain
VSTKGKFYFESFGSALIYAIENNRLSAQDFSKKWGKDPGQVSKYINNQSMPRPKNIQEIEELLNVRFRKSNDGWQVFESKDAQQALESVEKVEEVVQAYIASGEKRADIPKLLELRDQIQKKIDSLIK